MGDTPDLGSYGLNDSAALEDAKAFNKGNGVLDKIGLLSPGNLFTGTSAYDQRIMQLGVKFIF